MFKCHCLKSHKAWSSAKLLAKEVAKELLARGVKIKPSRPSLKCKPTTKEVRNPYCNLQRKNCQSFKVDFQSVILQVCVVSEIQRLIHAVGILLSVAKILAGQTDMFLFRCASRPSAFCFDPAHLEDASS